jgi:neurofibromin 1
MRYQIDDDDLGSGSINMDVFASGATTMEIDPHKVDEASDTTINSLELWLVAQKLFKCIVDSERIMPTQIKQLMHHIDSEVGGRFSAQAQFRAVGGFLFLRMVCPALMAPQVYGLLDAPPHPVRRSLSLSLTTSCTHARRAL